MIAASGWALAHFVLDLELAAGLLDRALVLNSNLAEAWLWGGWMKNWLGEPASAIERFARAMRLNPIDPRMSGMRSGIAHAHFFLGRYDEASSWAAMALQDHPDFQPGLRIDAASNAMAGRVEQARKAVARLQQLNPAQTVSNLKDSVGPYRAAEYLRAIRTRIAASRVTRMTIASMRLARDGDQGVRLPQSAHSGLGLMSATGDEGDMAIIPLQVRYTWRTFVSAWGSIDAVDETAATARPR